MSYLINKYTRLYFSIVMKYQNNPPDKGEIHHITPKSLGGSNSKTNSVLVPRKAHLLLHHLLIKMTTGKYKAKMVFAYWRMRNGKDKFQIGNLSSYDYARKMQSAYMSEMMTGKVVSEETRKKI